jgi:hypothetical protein
MVENGGLDVGLLVMQHLALSVSWSVAILTLAYIGGHRYPQHSKPRWR